MGNFDPSTAAPVSDDPDAFDLTTAKPAAHVPQSFDSLGNGQFAPTGSSEAKAAQSPTSGMSGTQLALAGAGKAPIDLGRGIGQMMGLESREDIKNSRVQDAPLMASTPGKVGNFAGNVTQMLPAAFIPGANTVAGAGTIGALNGLMQPSTSTGETLENTGLGAALGPASILVGRAAGGVYGLAKGLMEPFLPQGPTRIAAKALQRFAGSPQDADAAASALAQSVTTLPGVQPTTAELANNPGISQLQRSLQNIPSLLTSITNRNSANRSAMTQALGNIGGTPQDMAYALHQRSMLSSPLYDSATNVTVPADADLGSLLARPSMQKAWNRAQDLANERGLSLTSPNANDVSGQTLQYLKMGLNDMLETAPQKGIAGHELNALQSTLGQFNKWTMKNVPQLRAADRSYQDLSAPINQMQIGQQLSQRLVPALNDFGAAGGLNSANYANAVRNGDQLAAQATGMPNATLAGSLRPDQMQTINQVGQQLARTSGINVGRATGSNTAQNLIGQHVMEQILGPMGLPTSWAQSVFGRTLARPIEFAAKVAEPDVQGLLGKAALDPQLAGQLLAAKPNSKAARLLWKNQGLLTSPTLSGGRALVDTSQQ